MLGEDEPAVIPAPRPDRRRRRRATLHAAFAAQAARHADAVAVCRRPEQLTYAELAARAARIAAALRERGEGPGSIVGLVLDRGVDLPAAILGVLRPAPRTCRSTRRTRPTAPPTSSPSAGCGPCWPPRPPRRRPRRRRRRSADPGLDWQDPAWSGAAPAPVAADVPGRARLRHLHLGLHRQAQGRAGRAPARAAAARRPRRAASASAPTTCGRCSTRYAFDFSVWELWGALLHGGRLRGRAARGRPASPDAFAELCARERVTVLARRRPRSAS